MTNTITPKFKKQLKAQAHALNPIVIVGNKGLTENVINEVNLGLEVHELIKVRVQETDKNVREQILTEIASKTSATLVQIIGKIGIFYRKRSPS